LILFLLFSSDMTRNSI